jgi:di-heme cytochrome c peroxidase
MPMKPALAVSAVLVLSLATPLPIASATGPSPSLAECPPTRGVLAIDDIARGRCLFHSTTVFGQDPRGPFPSCAVCHYGRDKTDRGVHLVEITNAAGQTEQVLRKTPSLLKAHADGPFGADGRFARVQDAAQAAIVSPVEMRGARVSDDQLDALAAFVLALPGSEPEPAPALPAPTADVLRLIAIGKSVFFGRGACVTCHAGSEFTNHAITTDQVNLTFTGTTDPGAQFVGTGGPAEFKVPSLLFLDGDAPFMHNGALAHLGQVARFYNESLSLGLTPLQTTGLEYWLRNCLDPRHHPTPSTC